MATWIVFSMLLVAAFFAARYCLRKAKRGECVGCSGCESGQGGCHCNNTSLQDGK